MASVQFFKTFQAIPAAIAAANDSSSDFAQIETGLEAVRTGLETLHSAQVEQTEAIDRFEQLLEAQTQVLIGAIAGEPTPIELADRPESCIKAAFTFMRTLNEIESLVTDSKFTERNKNNTAKLKQYFENALHRNCITLLSQKVDEEQLEAAEAEQLKAEFDALFAPITADLSDRAERLVAIHQFRDRILHFFAEGCTDEPPEEPSKEPSKEPPKEPSKTPNPPSTVTLS